MFPVHQFIKTKRYIIPLLFLALFLPILLLNPQNHTPLTHQVSADSIQFYVSPTGNDSNNGSQSSPFATITKAASIATPGATIHVLPGTYTESVVNNQSGTAAAPITFISDTKWAAKITFSGNGSTKSYLFRNNGDYIHVIGFDMSGKGVTDGLDNFGSNNLIQGNHIHNMTNINCSGTPGGAGLGDDAGTNNIYDGNMVDHIGDYPTKCDYVHGIYVDDIGDIVTNNIAYDNVGNGLYTNHGTGSVLFANNLSFANDEYGVGINGSASGNVVENNILIGNGIAGIKTWSGTSNTQILHNILYNNASTYVLNGSAVQTNNLLTNPQLVNYQPDGSGDYHLMVSSPAIDVAIATGAPSIDYDGNTRPQGNGYDIGPYEYLSGVTITMTPSATPTALPTVTLTLTPTPTQFVSPTPTTGTTVSVDTPASSFIQASSTKSFSWSHTVGTNANRLLMVQVVTSSSSNTVSSVKMNGVSLKKLSAVNCGTSCRDEVWYLLNPTSGIHTIAVTTSSSAPVTATAISFSNVLQSSPLGTAATTSGKGTVSSVSPQTTTTQTVVDFYGNQASGSFVPTAASGQLQEVNVGNSVAQEAAISIKTGQSPSTKMSWSWPNSNGYADVAVGIN